jgi:integrase/recombinase XerD
MRAARGLRGELHAATTQTLIGLMAVTGMRVGEAIGLARDDVDRPGQLIRVIDGKFGKSREVAVHQTTIAALDRYGELRHRVCPRPQCDAFFLTRNGTRLLYQCVHLGFSASSLPPGLRTARPGAVHGRTACATASRSTRCATGTPTTSTCKPGCRC